MYILIKKNMIEENQLSLHFKHALKISLIFKASAITPQAEIAKFK